MNANAMAVLSLVVAMGFLGLAISLIGIGIYLDRIVKALRDIADGLEPWVR